MALVKSTDTRPEVIVRRLVHAMGGRYRLHYRSLPGSPDLVFAARLDLQLKDRFGWQVEPREWFLVPLSAIDEAIERIKDGSIARFRYDPISVGFIAD